MLRGGSWSLHPLGMQPSTAPITHRDFPTLVDELQHLLFLSFHHVLQLLLILQEGEEAESGSARAWMPSVPEAGSRFCPVQEGQTSQEHPWGTSRAGHPDSSVS